MFSSASDAHARVNIATPDFVAEYAGSSFSGNCAASDAVFTITPPPRARR
jgi:hypothetical protein